MRVEKIVAGGKGLLRDENGKVVLIPGVLPGEEIENGVVIKHSPDRRKPFCPYYGKCGGCDFQIVDEGKSAFFKEEIVRDALYRIGKIGEIPEFEKPSWSRGTSYRRRAGFRVNIRTGKIGFLAAKSDDIVPVENCPILTEGLNFLLSDRNTLLERARKLMFEGRVGRDGTVEIHAIEGDEGVSLGSETVTVSGYRANANVFFQSNALLFREFISYVESLAVGGNIIDLYSGVGTFSALFKGRRVYSVEMNPECLRFSKINAPEAISVTSDASRWLNTAKLKADTVIVDPPRVGLARDAISGIKKVSPERIIYVSCNPVTLSRDISEFTGYYAESVKVFDFFPGTSHVETVVLMSRVKG